MPSQQLLRYLLVGGTSYIIEIGVLALFRYGFHFSNLLSVGISFWVGLLAAFILQKTIAFKNTDKTKRVLTKQFLSYGILAAWNYIFTLSLVSLFSSHMSVLIVRTIAIAIITCWNFLIYRTIFKSQATPTKREQEQLRVIRNKRAKQRRQWMKKLRRFNKAISGLKSTYVLVSLIILFVTVVFWALLGAQLELGNADEIVEGSLFKTLSSVHNAVLPGAHTFLLKWPLFLINGANGNSSLYTLMTTLFVCLVTVGGLVYVLYRIDKRPRVFGTLVLALSVVLLLIPAQPYAGGLLPVNFAMLATRNIEYLFYILAIVLVIRTRKVKSKTFVVSIIIMSLLFSSDKLFQSLALGAGILVFAAYALLRRGSWALLGFRFLFATLVSVAGSTLIVACISLFHIAHIAGTSSNPYGFISSFHDLGLGIAFAFLGTLTNIGANPVFDVGIIKSIPATTIKRLLSPFIIPFCINLIVAIAGIVATAKVIILSLIPPKKPRWNAKKKPAPYADAVALSIFLIASSIAALAVFVLTKHYYAVDARYVTIVLFAIFVSLATYMRTRSIPTWFGARRTTIVLLVGIALGCIWTGVVHTQQKGAYASANARNQKVAEVLNNRKADVLVGDYWRVVPIVHEDTDISDSSVPLSNCTDLRASLLSKEGTAGFTKHSFTYLLSLDRGLADFPSCSIAQVVAAFGHPNASTLIAGTNERPKEILLFYDGGSHKDSPKPRGSSFATILPSTPKQVLTNPVCTDNTTVMNIVAHQDDDLLFMNPDLSHEIASGDCIRTVYVTAGDAGHGSVYWLGREKGSQAAYNSLMGFSQSTIWIQKTVKLGNGEYITVSNPIHNKRVSLIFMRLADGDLNGSGFSTSNFESLTKLSNGRITTIHSVDGQSAYTETQLNAALGELINTYQPNFIHTQAPENYGSLYQDHSDHIAVGQLARSASQLYANQAITPITYYVGYPIRERPVNVSEPDLKVKINAFLAYGLFDGGVCHSIAQCNQGSAYGYYLNREYTTDQY